ncbi:MAG: metalloprotease, partial [Nanoarchaeota archaeon]
MKFSQKEIKDLFFAGLLISLAFAILLSPSFSSFNSHVFKIFIFAFFTAGLGFLLHELAHKYLAQSYKLHAEFHAFYPMLFLAVALSF